MLQIKLKVKYVMPNGAVVLVPYERYKATEKKVLKNKKGITPIKPVALEKVMIAPATRFMFVPMDNDKTKYKVGDVFDVTLKKV